MSFAPLLGPGSPSCAFIRLSISEYLSSLAALCSSILAATFASIDNLATRIPPSWCPGCRFKQIWESYSNQGTETAAPVSSLGAESYILKKFEDIDSESTTTALVLDSNTKICTLKKLEDIDGGFYRATRSKTPPQSLSLSLLLITPPQSKKRFSATSSLARHNPSRFNFPANPNSSAKSSATTATRARTED